MEITGHVARGATSTHQLPLPSAPRATFHPNRSAVLPPPETTIFQTRATAVAAHLWARFIRVVKALQADLRKPSEINPHTSFYNKTFLDKKKSEKKGRYWMYSIRTLRTFAELSRGSYDSGAMTWMAQSGN
ncbi:hypothetical protein CGGC5_v016122 [Colletotrichum fructicola Nara gc5]|uniref:Uncharacterized protein n=1 Tax=Colletotrichum fructicola (strain Nara gc5) TaxID=1213859 RepID=A0A7J6IFH1_COLFN|nr:hypothetical protein CGGC5_v016122 [Colletotrichum fructicola Nara gc5]